MISLATSSITEAARRNVIACLDEGRIGSGRFVAEFERKAERFLGVKHAIAVCNGTIADMVAMAVLKLKNPKKNEVIVPALTFIAHTNSVLLNGLVPVFVDVDDACQMDPEKVEGAITEQTLAIFPAHLLGKMADIGAITATARRYGISVVEDCCEAWGASKDGKKAGTYGAFGTYSFFPSHTVTTGEGGMIVTNDDELADLARKMINHGRKGDGVLQKFHFDFVAYNGKMSNLNAAVGAGIIDESERIIGQRRKNVDLFNTLLKQGWEAESPHCYPFIYPCELSRDDALLRLESNAIEGRKLFSCIPTDEYKLDGDYPNARRFGETGLFVPVHQNLSEEDVKKIALLL